MSRIIKNNTFFNVIRKNNLIHFLNSETFNSNVKKANSDELPIEDILTAESELYSLTHKMKRENAKEESEGESVILMEDCEHVPPTVVLNDDLFVDFKYAFFHHDAEDVQQNGPNFIGSDIVEPIVLCTGADCRQPS